jgi:N-acetylmuramoyl-L-alanine amidase
MGACGITLAAKPGTSNHEAGLAIDVNDNAGWNKYLTSQGFTWQVSKHFL